MQLENNLIVWVGSTLTQVEWDVGRLLPPFG